MKSTLRILLVEDSPADAELLLAALEEEGIAFDAVRVDTKAEFLSALSTDRFDLILSDCSMPSFDGFSALKIFRELTACRKLPEAPFIFVSGTLGEELAIETLKNGATDYVLKHRLSRLGPAVFCRRILSTGKIGMSCVWARSPTAWVLRRRAAST